MIIEKRAKMARAKSDYIVSKDRVRLTAGDVVRIACEMLGITQAELARKAGMHAPHLSDIISGKRKIGRAVAVRLAGVLQIPPEHILFAGHTPRDGADVETLYSKIESSLVRRNGFLQDALKTLQEAQRQKDKERVAAMKHAMHFISLAIKSNPADELSFLIKKDREGHVSRLKK